MAAARGAARATIRATTSTTRSSRSAPRCGRAWSRRSSPGTRGRDMSDAPESKLGGIGRWLLRDLPYAAMLVLAVGGIVLASFRGPTTYIYWMALAPIYALIVVASG